MPIQLNRVAKRAAMGLARLGSYSGNSSGDLIVSFSTAVAEVNHEDQDKPEPDHASANAAINPIFEGDGPGDRGSNRQRPGRGADDDGRQRRALFRPSAR